MGGLKSTSLNHLKSKSPMEQSKEVNRTAIDESKQIAFGNLKYQIGSILTNKFLEYNEGKFHTAVELNPATHAITEFVFNASQQCEALKEENERLIENCKEWSEHAECRQHTINNQNHTNSELTSRIAVMEEALREVRLTIYQKLHGSVVAVMGKYFKEIIHTIDKALTSGKP
jgi:hypothetical protein